MFRIDSTNGIIVDFPPSLPKVYEHTEIVHPWKEQETLLTQQSREITPNRFLFFSCGCPISSKNNCNQLQNHHMFFSEKKRVRTKQPDSALASLNK